MKVLLYLFVILYCVIGQTNEKVANSENDITIKYQELKMAAIDGDINSQYEIFNFPIKSVNSQSKKRVTNVR